MPKKFLVAIDLNKNELLNARLQNLAAAPANPVIGQMYFDTGLDSQRIFTAAGWENVGAIGAGEVATGMLADGAVTTVKIADGNVTLAKLAANSVDASKIVDGSVGNAELANLSVDNGKIAGGAVDAGKLAADAVTTVKILNGNVTLAKLAPDSVDSSKIVDGSIVNADINAAAGIALSKLATDPLARANHTGTQLAATISDFNTAVRTNRLDQMAAPTAAVAMGGQRLTNLAEPQVGSDAATKNYVDGVASGLDFKASVRVATTAALGALNGTPVIDGVQTVAGDRVLVKNQADATTNGIYVVAAGAWARAADADSSAEMTPGSFVFVEEGGTQGDTAWVLSTNGPINLGATGLTFTQFAAPGNFVAGNGLTLTGNTFDIGAGPGISVTADTITIAALGVATGMIADGAVTLVKLAANSVDASKIVDGSVGTAELTDLNVTTAKVADGAITSAKIADGTIVNADIAPGAAIDVTKVNGAVRKVAGDIGGAVAVAFPHNLGTFDVQARVFANAAPREDVEVTIERTDINTVTIRFDVAPAAAAYRVVVTG